MEAECEILLLPVFRQGCTCVRDVRVLVLPDIHVDSVSIVFFGLVNFSRDKGLCIFAPVADLCKEVLVGLSVLGAEPDVLRIRHNVGLPNLKGSSECLVFIVSQLG